MFRVEKELHIEKLKFIRLDEQKLRSEDCIHLKDAMMNDGNIENMGKLVILPSMFARSPRHIYEYAQDTVSYVRKHGRPDLYITFTCNPSWSEIIE